MDKNELPQNWIRTTIGNISHKPQYGYTTKSSKSRGDIKYIRTTDISKGQIDWDKVPFCTVNPDNIKKYILNEGDIIVSRAGSIGISYLLEEIPLKAVFASYLIRFKPIIVKPKFIKYYLDSPAYWDLVSGASAGIAVQNINATKLSNFEINLPPKLEQDRIVAKLDRLMGRVETMQKSLDRIPQLLRDFRQQVLTHAVTGKLTEEWRGSKHVKIDSPITINETTEEVIPKWSWINLNEVAVLESGHTPRKSVSEYWENGNVPWISLQDIRAFHGKTIFDTKLKPTLLGIENSSARLLPKGTVCFSRDISVGFTTIMGREMATTQHFANWICGENLNNKYLLYAFMQARNYLIHKGKGTTVKTLYYKDLKQLMFYKPPMAEQIKIVEIVENLLEKSSVIEEKFKQLKNNIESLPQAILQKAFKGELVEQLPSDGDARALLEEIEKLKKNKPHC